MKKKLVLLFLVLLVHTGFSQEINLFLEPKATLGKMIYIKTPLVEGGENMVNDVIGIVDDKYMTGFQCLAGISYRPAKWISLQTGIDYLQKGGIYKNYLGEFYTCPFRNHYLGIPLEVSLLPNCRFNFFGGYEASVLLDHFWRFEGNIALNHFDHAVYYGIGIRLWNTRLKLSHYQSVTPDLIFKFGELCKINYLYEGFNFSLEIPICNFNRKKAVVNP